MTRLVLVVALVLSGCAVAAPTKVVIELKDGSRLVGEVEIDSLGLASSLGAVRVNPAQLVSLVPADDNERVTIRSTSGDVVTGVPTPAKLEVKTSFGKVTIPYTLATRIEFGSAVAATPPAPAPVAPLPPNNTTLPMLSFRCADLGNIEEQGQTTGGSVYLFTVNFRVGQPLLVIAATVDPGAIAKLDRVRSQLRGCQGSQRVIVATQPKFASPTHTTLGDRVGWAAFADNIVVQ